MANARLVTVADMLDARDQRAERQKRLLKASSLLICLTMNIPGPRKTSPEILAAFREGVRRVRGAVGTRPILYEAFTGPEAYFPINADAEDVKRQMCHIEDEEPLGRLYDLDVLSADSEKCSRAALGLSPRRCLLCGKPAFECARSRAHSVSELSKEVSRRIDKWQRSTLPERISEAAVNALIHEAETTPKPGLVDRRNNGSHPDMSLEMLLRSARSLKPYLRECARTGMTMDECDAFPALRTLGMEAERAMLCATGGVNAHKGAIFLLGLLAASAAACLRSFEADAEEICARAGRMAAPHMEAHFRSLRAETADFSEPVPRRTVNEADRHGLREEDRSSPRMEAAHTFGDRLYLAAGLRGARGEAADGFPSVLRIALPALDEDLGNTPDTLKTMTGRAAVPDADVDETAETEEGNASGVYALLRLAAETDDTTLIRRGGLARAETARSEIRALLSSGVTREKVERLDDRFIRENLTLGGCADLLACAYFLKAVREI